MGNTAPITEHIPVLLQETIDGLNVHPGGRYLDATVGGGGHAQAILNASSPDGLLLGLDRDPEAAARAAERLAAFGSRVQIRPLSFIHLKDAVAASGWQHLDGVLFDLGYSSWQIDDPQRGFSFRFDAPLDMRFNPAEDETSSAADLVNELPAAELAALIRRYGEEPHSRRIAQAIVAARPINTTGRLAEVIAATVKRRGPLHPATRTFQALRIAVNQELATLEAALPQAVQILRPGGRLAVITFHSLEDRIVKQFFKREQRDCICPPEAPICTCGHRATLRLINRKPIVPTPEEIAANPRSRSAKLRIAERLDEEPTQ